MSEQLYGLLVLNPQEVKEVVYVSKSGGYYDETRILWDERKDGPLPSEAIEAPDAVVISGDLILIDTEKKEELDAAKIDEVIQAGIDESELDKCKEKASNIDSIKELEDLRMAVKYLLLKDGVI
jgi:hypothetical protein